jgi:transcriptional regulator with XRE-family HTH domain
MYYAFSHTPYTEGVMTEELSPSLRRWELGRTLREIRETRGLTIEQVSAALSAIYTTGFSAAKISRLETGKRGANPRDVRDLCDYYGVDPEERDRLIGLAKAVRTETRLQGAREAYVEYVAVETRARTMRTYEPMFVPGLLQTVDYHRATFDSFAPLDPTSSDDRAIALIQLRHERQRRLDGPEPLALNAIIDENVLNRVVGSEEVMALQLRHLTEMSERPNVTLRVIPQRCGVYPGCESSGFAMLELDETEHLKDNVCYLEGFVGPIWAESAADRARVARTFEHLERLALDEDTSRELIIAAEHRLA